MCKPYLNHERDTSAPLGLTQFTITHFRSQDITKEIIPVKHQLSFVLMTYLSIFLCRPSYGGKFCEGSSRSYKLCNTEDCPLNTVDYRAQQCAEFNSKQFRGWYYTWRPYTRVDGETSIKAQWGEVLSCESCRCSKHFCHYGYFLSFQIKMSVSCTALLRAMISSSPWPAKLRMGRSAHRTVLMSVLTDCVR